jgi:hypothetical protein
MMNLTKNNTMISKEDFNKHFLGYNIIDCVVRRSDFLYFIVREDYTQRAGWRDSMDAPNETTLKKRVIPFMRYKTDKAQWSSVTLTGQEIMVGGVSFTEPEQFVSMDSDGRVYAVGSGSSGLEGLVDPENTGLHRGSTAKLRAINNRLYVCATGRTVGWRAGIGKWQWFTKDIAYEYKKDREVAGFEDIDGFTEQDIYLVGRGGDIWTFDSVQWQKRKFPSNISLNTVCCAPDGTVYVSGYEGETYRGAGDVWKQIAKPELSIPFKDMIWYEDRVWCTNDYGIWWIKGDILELADVPAEIKVCAGNLSTRDGVLLLAGYYGAAVLENGTWKVIFNTNEMTKK